MTPSERCVKMLRSEGLLANDTSDLRVAHSIAALTGCDAMLAACKNLVADFEAELGICVIGDHVLAEIEFVADKPKPSPNGA